MPPLDFNGALDAQTDHDYEEHHGLNEPEDRSLAREDLENTRLGLLDDIDDIQKVLENMALSQATDSEEKHSLNNCIQNAISIIYRLEKMDFDE